MDCVREEFELMAFCLPRFTPLTYLKVLGADVMWFALLVSEDIFFRESQHKHMWFGVINVPFIYDSEEKDHKLPW